MNLNLIFGPSIRDEKIFRECFDGRAFCVRRSGLSGLIPSVGGRLIYLSRRVA